MKPMALKALNKINGNLKIFYRKNKFVTPTPTHLDYTCSAWQPNLNEKLKKKIQIAQNKCVRFCLKLDKRHHISSNQFESINWLSVHKRVYQCINAIIFKFVNKFCSHYLNDVYDTSFNAKQNQEGTLPTSRFLFGKLTRNRKAFHALAPLYGTIQPDLCKKTTVLNTFKHNLKKKLEARILRIIIGIYLYSLLIHLSIYSCIDLYIYLFIYLLIFLSHLFSLLFLTFILPTYHFLSPLL